ncbi:HET-domain-containing protein [Xylaria sp. FL1042]|nr:HET-domain-containing protein [Xylaria sp. FL1042]
MRLIDVKTLQLKEFHHNIPPYAILSHTWGSEEVTFQEYLLTTSSDVKDYSGPKRKGLSKIINACGRARLDGLAYLWCDTNCIDKSSSAELTEAINSMYAWYRDAAICYAYLEDVFFNPDIDKFNDEVKKSRWFTRGWTLQELLAPEKVLFFRNDWIPIANRQQLADVIHEVTRIHVGALQDRNTIHDYSVAQRMSWAADRQTSREEDIAYCLLGIFGINMPLLYGEGMKAFTRLQEEVIKASDDQSIFAWDFLGSPSQSQNGILASSPSEFASCGSMVRDVNFERWPYSTTNLGVSLQLPTIQTFINKTILVGLNCSIELREYGPRRDLQTPDLPCCRFPVWIWLRSIGHNIYTRSPSPVSRTLLTDLYPYRIDCVASKLFGITSAFRVESWVSSIYSSAPCNNLTSTGFHLTISFGRLRPRTRTFESAFLPGEYTVNQLAPRGSPALSHEIISAGKYIVLLSIAWDHQRHPKYWRHTILMNLNDDTIRTLSANDWVILFPSQQKSQARRSDDVERIESIHDQARRISGEPTTPTEKSASPFVHLENVLWQDHHGQVRVVAHLTFQEVIRPQPIS